MSEKPKQPTIMEAYGLQFDSLLEKGLFESITYYILEFKPVSRKVPGSGTK